MRRRGARLVDYVSVGLVAWMALVLVPVEWVWFAPGEYVVSDGTADRTPTVIFERNIKRNVVMTYHVTVRDVARKRTICDPVVGPFQYHTDAVLPDTIDLVWWSGGNVRCWPLKTGSYISETCWTVTAPFWGLVPPKTTCRRSNPFTIREDDRAQQRQIEELSRGLKAIERKID